ncbi:tetratricopeptide repeat protein [Bacteroidota bacterium]
MKYKLKVMKRLLILLICFSMTIFCTINIVAQDTEKAFEYFNNEEYEMAASEFEKVLENIEKENGRNREYAKICLYTAVSYSRSDFIEDAINFYTICIETYKKIPGGIWDEFYGVSLNNFAALYDYLEQYEKALPLSLESLEICVKTSGKESSDYRLRLGNLAGLYEMLEQYDKALFLYIEALENCENNLGKEHPDYRTILNHIALLYYSLEQYDLALTSLIEVLENCENTLGKEHPDYRAHLENLAVLYEEMGQPEKAIPIYLEALENCEIYIGKEHPDYRYLLNSLAGVYRTLGQYEKALPLYMEVVENIEYTLGKEDEEYGISLINLAGLYETMGQYGKALPLYLGALENYEISIGIEHPDYRTLLNSIAGSYQTMGQYEKALPLYLEALENTKISLGKEHSEYGIRLGNLAGLYEDMGQYDKALPLYQEALENTENTLGKEHPMYGIRLGTLATLYYSMGQYEKALPLYLEARNNFENTLGKEHQYYSNLLNDLAGLYGTIGQYEKALPLYMEVLENCEKTVGKEHEDYGTYLNNLAILYYSMGQYEKALTFYKESLENCKNALGREHPEYGDRLNNLAALYTKMGQYENALPLNLEAVENTKNGLGEEHLEYGNRLNNLAGLYYSMGQYEKALPLYLEAIKNCENTLGKKHSEYGDRLNNLAALYAKMEQYEKALPLYLEAVENIENNLGKEHSKYGVRLGNLAELYMNQRQYEKALPLLIENIEIINYNIRQNFAFMSEKDKDAYLKTVSNTFDVFNSLAYKYHKENLTTNHVYDNTLANKGVLLKSASSMRSAILFSGDTILIKKFEQWTDLNRQIARLYSLEKSKRIIEPEELEDLATTMERELMTRSKEFGDYKSIQNTSWQNVSKRLERNEAAIEFISFEFYDKMWTDSIFYCAIVVKQNSTQPEMIPLFEEKQLERYLNKSKTTIDEVLVNKLYGEKRNIGTLNDFSLASYADSLYALIWKPLDSILHDVERVYYSPSGLLHTISFAAIPYNDSLLLSDNYELIYLSSSANLANPKSNNVDFTSAQVALYGGLIYDLSGEEMLANSEQYQEERIGDSYAYNQSYDLADSNRESTWSYLEGTLEETENINTLLIGENVSTIFLYGQEGSEESFKSLAGSNSPEIIHMATHGFFFPDLEIEKWVNMGFVLEERTIFKDSDNPLIRSGIILAGANRAWKSEEIPEGIDDGILTAFEVSGMDLYNTQLVVLSACETGLGDIKGDEGVYGLQRSFKMAGVDYLIMSLWQVPDKETSEFMTLFYNKLLKTNNIRDAFAETQKSMRNKYDPYYWAAFVLIE